MSRRRNVAKRIDAYNRELAQACRAYPHDRCHWDDGRTHNVKFTPEMVGVDRFHPSQCGQRELARTPISPEWFRK